MRAGPVAPSLPRQPSVYFIWRGDAHTCCLICVQIELRNQDSANKVFLEASSPLLSSSSPSPSLSSTSSSSSPPSSSSGPLVVGMHWQPSQAAGKIWKDLLCSSLLTLLYAHLLTLLTLLTLLICSAHHHSSNFAHPWQVPQLTQKQDGQGNWLCLNCRSCLTSSKSTLHNNASADCCK